MGKRTRVVRIKISDLIKLQKLIKALEANSTRTIGGLTQSRFLAAKIELEPDEDQPVEIEVKTHILHIAGDFSSEPSELEDNINLSKHLLYGDDEYKLLGKRLDKVVRRIKSTARITTSEIGDCDTVGDCLELVNGKIS